MSPRNGQKKYCVEIMDTTLRDGEQTPGVAFTPAEKLGIVRLLINQLHVDRVEIGSAGVSDGEREAITGILAWAGRRFCKDRMEILGFADQGRSVDWICSVGGSVVNLLVKGSPHHCRIQLGKEPAQHREAVRREVLYALEKGLAVNVYLEDWTGGMAADFGYVYELVQSLADLDIKRFMLADTLGCATPERIALYMDWMNSAFPGKHFDFHGHNDYGLVTANSIAAVNKGAKGIHTSINGLGERAGNQSLSSLVVAIHDQTQYRTRIAEKSIQHASEVVQALSGKRFAWNTPVVGSDVFTQTCGVHADGDKKGNLYSNKLLPERFGRNRNYALGKLSGKASVEQNLEMLGLEDLEVDQRKKVLQEIVRLGDRKKQVTPADLPYIISNILRTPAGGRIQVADYHIESRMKGLPRATVTLRIDAVECTASSEGDGGYDAFVKVLRKELRKHGIVLPKLADYQVRIPPGGKTDALVETSICWELPGGGRLTTSGVDCDQMAAAIIATEKMLNLVVRRNGPPLQK